MTTALLSSVSEERRGERPPGLDPVLGAYRRGVAPDSVQGDTKGLRDFTVGGPPEKEAKDLLLARREPLHYSGGL
jgi:hypothetical protein